MNRSVSPESRLIGNSMDFNDNDRIHSGENVSSSFAPRPSQSGWEGWRETQFASEQALYRQLFDQSSASPFGHAQATLSHPVNHMQEIAVQAMPETIHQQNFDHKAPPVPTSTVTKSMAIHKTARSIIWPAKSDATIRYPSLQAQIDSQTGVRTLVKGLDSGRNLCFIADDQKDGLKRLRYNIKINRGRSGSLIKGVDLSEYPDPKVDIIPCGTTLREMCQQYPRHCWGEGMRILLAEGWGGKEVYDSLPEKVKSLFTSKDNRGWNSLQQGQGREAKKMRKEDGLPEYEATSQTVTAKSAGKPAGVRRKSAGKNAGG